MSLVIQNLYFSSKRTNFQELTMNSKQSAEQINKKKRIIIFLFNSERLSVEKSTAKGIKSLFNLIQLNLFHFFTNKAN